MVVLSSESPFETVVMNDDVGDINSQVPHQRKYTSEMDFSNE